MACELAGSEYSFSPYGSSHWAALTDNHTCPDLVIDPTFIHYLPSNSSGSGFRLLSVNQFKYRHFKKFKSYGSNKKNSKPTLGVSNRQVKIIIFSSEFNFLVDIYILYFYLFRLYLISIEMPRRVSTSALYPPAAPTSSPCVGISDVGPASCPVRLYPTQIMKYLTNMLSSKKKR